MSPVLLYLVIIVLHLTQVSTKVCSPAAHALLQSARTPPWQRVANLILIEFTTRLVAITKLQTIKPEASVADRKQPMLTVKQAIKEHASRLPPPQTSIAEQGGSGVT